jgi:hypothetical protein
MTGDDEIWDDLFHGCAFAAFLDQAAVEQGWPDPDATRRRAYRYYEQALADRHRSLPDRPVTEAEPLTMRTGCATVES